MLTTIVPWSQYKTLKFSQCSIFSRGGTFKEFISRGGTCPGCPPGSYTYAMHRNYTAHFVQAALYLTLCTDIMYRNCTAHFVQDTMYRHYVQTLCTGHFVQDTIYRTLCTGHYVQDILYRTLCTDIMYKTLCTESVQHTLYKTLCTGLYLQTPCTDTMYSNCTAHFIKDTS